MKTVINKIARLGPGWGAATMIAAVAISACSLLRLGAAVIDDFDGPQKFAKGGGGTNYFLWGLTNGQMMIANPPYPVRWSPSNPGATYDNVYWPSSLPGVILDGGRTLELLMDLNHTSTDDLFLLLGIGDPDENHYAVIVDRNEVALMKYGAWGMTIFYWDSLATTSENVNIRLALTRTNNYVAITVKILDKVSHSRLYQRWFADGPGQDGLVPPPDPHGMGIWTRDGGAPYTNFTFAWAGAWQLIPTSPPPMEMLLDNLEYDVYYPPHIEIAPATIGVALNWKMSMEEHIVVQADQLTGPWCPCPQPHTQTGDAFCLTMRCQPQQRFFKLAPGRQFTDGFSSVLPTWTPWFQGAGKEWVVTNDVLKVSLFGMPAYGGLALLPLGATNSEAVLRDFSASVDAMDWLTSGTNWSTLGLFGRGRIISTNYGTAYFGGIGLNYDGIPGRVTPWVHDGSTETWGPPFDIESFPPPYRLKFSGVGNKMSLQVLHLTTGEIIREMSFTSSAYATGVAGLWFNGRTDAGDSYTNTVDNFFLNGTKP